MLVCCFAAVTGHTQGLVLKEKFAGFLFRGSSPVGALSSKTRYDGELDYTLTTNGLIIVNRLHDDRPDQVNVFENLKYRCFLHDDKTFRLTGIFTHNLGFQHYIDSITRINIDDDNLYLRLDYMISGKASLMLLSNFTSRLTNGFDYIVSDSGNQLRILSSSFLTPLIWTASFGINYLLKDYGWVSLGLSSFKLTSILNKGVFGGGQIMKYYGIEQGKTHLLEYGVTFQLQIDRNISQTLHWDCDLLLFKNYNSQVDLALKNLIGLKINRYLKASLQMRVFYEEERCKHLQFENLLSVGFNLHL
jgi:hypothetical protein